MSVTVVTNRKDREANGVLTDFDFDFLIYQDSDLLVYEVELDEDGFTVSAELKTLGADYTVALDPTLEGGTVHTLYTPADGKIIRMIGDIPETQETDFPIGTGFSETRIRTALDKLTRLVNQVRDRLNFAILRPISDGDTDTFTLEQLDAAVAAAEADRAAAEAAKTAALAAQAAAQAAAASVPTMATILAAVLPIGSLYSNGADTTNPATLLGFGTWVPFAAGKTIFGLDAGGDSDFDALADTGGSKTKNMAHTHTGTTGSGSGDVVNVDGSNTPVSGTGHTHSFTTDSGGSATQDVLNPYVVAAIWRRTA